MRRVDLAGLRFGRLLVERYDHSTPAGRAMWACRCDCGGSCVVRGTALTTGNSTTCGCGRVEAMRETGRRNRTHGLSRTPEYRSWARMIDRCHNPDNPQYGDYGGRGIKVCERWLWSFEAFLEDMGPKRPGKPTIDRRDNNAGYSKSNCRWASYSEQNLNRRPFKRRKLAA